MTLKCKGEGGARPAQLYRYYDADDKLLYVGMSLMAVTRAMSHRHAAHWYPAAVKMTIEQYGSKGDALLAETAAIKKERPLHNIVHNIHGIPPPEKPDAMPKRKDKEINMDFPPMSDKVVCKARNAIRNDLGRKYLSTEDAAEYTGVDPIVLEILRRRGEGPRYYDNGVILRYDMADLDSFLVQFGC